MRKMEKLLGTKDYTDYTDDGATQAKTLNRR